MDPISEVEMSPEDAVQEQIATEPTAAVVPLVAPTNLNELIEEFAKQKERTPESPTTYAMVAVLRRFHFWPAIQVKKFFDDSNLILLHNTYKRIDVDSFKKLYEECRSVVLDMDAPSGQKIVVTYAHNIPKRMVVGQYQMLQSMQDTPPIQECCTISYEGTMITAYEHKGVWKFGTSTCPSVDASRYHHPTKTHGTMFNETIVKLMGMDKDTSVAELRASFAERLNKDYAYTFLLVHYENKHIMDYSAEFGNEYMMLFQLNVRSRQTLEDIDDTTTGIPAPKQFQNSEEAFQYMNNNSDTTYGIFIKTVDAENNQNMYLVSNDKVLHHEEVNLGNANIWQNLLNVYMIRKPDYHIKDYLKEFGSQLVLPTNTAGVKLSPTFIIHTAMCAIRDTLLSAYRSSTYYDMTIQKYKIRRLNNEALTPTMRFHVNQLRYIQITDHVSFPIGERAILGYLCLHNTIKNIRILMDHISKNPNTYPMPFESMECIRILNKLLVHPVAQ
jgi:hypothetical protein